jgi:hypothetical protein
MATRSCSPWRPGSPGTGARCGDDDRRCAVLCRRDHHHLRHARSILKHPWYFLAYWLFNYLLLCLTAPIDLVVNERLRGGRLAVTTPLRAIARAAAAVLAAGLAFFSVSLLLELSSVSSLWPFEITPLVSRILGVWLGALAVAHTWIAWDGDRLRARPLLVAMPPTGALLAIVPLLHSSDVRPGAAGSLAAYLTLAAAMIVLPGLALGRGAEAASLAPAT